MWDRKGADPEPTQVWRRTEEGFLACAAEGGRVLGLGAAPTPAAGSKGGGDASGAGGAEEGESRPALVKVGDQVRAGTGLSLVDPGAPGAIRWRWVTGPAPKK